MFVCVKKCVFGYVLVCVYRTFRMFLQRSSLSGNAGLLSVLFCIFTKCNAPPNFLIRNVRSFRPIIMCFGKHCGVPIYIIYFGSPMSDNNFSWSKIVNPTKMKYLISAQNVEPINTLEPFNWGRLSGPRKSKPPLPM